jgi:YHS domain
MRLIFYVVVGVIILTLLRSVVEAIGKAFSSGSSSPSPATAGPRGQAPPSHQSLKKDPVCGTFVSTATAIQKTKGGETYYFCSAECRDKF